MQISISLIALGILIYALFRAPGSRFVYGLVIVAMLFLAMTPTAQKARETITNIGNTASTTADNFTR